MGISKTPLPSERDVRTIRAWLNDVAHRIMRLETRIRGDDSASRRGGRSGAIGSVTGFARLTGGTIEIEEEIFPTADIYRGMKNERKITENVDVYVRGAPGEIDWAEMEGVWIPVLKFQGTWEGVWPHKPIEEYPILGPEAVPEYVLAKVPDGEGGYIVGWKAATDDCDTEES